ncbi:MAG TPA: sugar transferase [Bryobacteraceae bacterium]|nr:sugar transferase [Bryobacteraceae bacterium]
MNRLLRTHTPAGVTGLLVTEAILLCYAYTLAGFASLPVDPEVVLLDTGGWKGLAWVLVAVLVSMHLHDLYLHIYVQSWLGLTQQLCAGFGLALLAEAGITYFRPGLRVPVRVMLVGSILAIILLIMWRYLYGTLVLSAVGKRWILFVGANPLVRQIADRIAQKQELGWAVAGYVGDSDGSPGPGSSGKHLGSMERLAEVARAIHPDRIVVGLTDRRQKMPVADLLKLRFAGYLIEEAPTTFEILCGRVATTGLRPAQLILSSEFAPNTENLRLQSLFNFVCALAGAILAVPLMLLIALAIRVSSPGPVLIRAERVGRGGRLFTHYSFRMSRSLSGGSPESEAGATAVGRILWQLGLVDLPSVLNVLRGEMSMVGPRAESPERVAALEGQIPYYRHRHRVKPGMTGWAQIHELDASEPLDPVTLLEYDLYYIKHMSLSLDAYVMLRTLKRVVQGRVSG